MANIQKIWKSLPTGLAKNLPSNVKLGTLAWKK